MSRFGPGDAFLVPLAKGGYALGAIARKQARRGGILAYFFQPRLKEIPSEVIIPPPETAIWVIRVGVQGLVKGSWPIVKSTGEDASKWPIPALGYTDMSGQSWREEHEDIFDHPLRCIPVSREEAEDLPSNATAGWLFAEERLDRILPA